MGSIRAVLLALCCALLLPAAASAATKPAATTGGVANLTPTTALLNGTVDPNGAATTYLFQYGTSRLYESRTAPLNAGAGNKGKKIAVAVGALVPNTKYHYRLVAQNSKGLTFGKDRTFRTKKQPLALSLAATPNPVRSGHATTLNGVLSGTGNANRQIKLESSSWPFTAWVQAGNPQVTGATGAFSFPILSVPSNTQYRVSLVANPATMSPVVVVGTTVKVTRHAKVFPGTKRGRIHFWGRLKPATDGATVQIQKLRKGNWITIAQTTAKATGKGFSRYSRRIKQKHGGRYRVVAVDTSGVHSVSVSRSIRRHHLRG
jgi:hypothetical protein